MKCQAKPKSAMQIHGTRAGVRLRGAEAAASCLHFDIFSFHLQQTGVPSIARVSHPARPVCCKVKIGLPWIHQCRGPAIGCRGARRGQLEQRRAPLGQFSASPEGQTPSGVAARRRAERAGGRGARTVGSRTGGRMFSWMGRQAGGRERSGGADAVQTVTGGLRSLYLRKVLPLEEAYRFHEFHSPALEDADFDNKPMILLVGQYSTGKTTFIRYPAPPLRSPSRTPAPHRLAGGGLPPAPAGSR
ncbi:hypothetical protein QTO34_019630 [Cnephaeus nilssonii]|uniref:EH domain-containing protein n=1 Tax=Cnephaeus nilssonii TaxID=3371016 RepID=A0AA40HXU0_CNENI|nr:hypothetical protein QTO34_019630 [Eptesicus nilssonii]